MSMDCNTPVEKLKTLSEKQLRKHFHKILSTERQPDQRWHYVIKVNGETLKSPTEAKLWTQFLRHINRA